jgi:hypothetical protein
VLPNETKTFALLQRLSFDRRLKLSCRPARACLAVNSTVSAPQQTQRSAERSEQRHTSRGQEKWIKLNVLLTVHLSISV